MSTTLTPPASIVQLQELYDDVTAATTTLQRSKAVPKEIALLVDEFDTRLRADAPLQLGADPYLTTMLFAAAFRAQKALRAGRADDRRRDLRVALEQFRQALRDIVANAPVGDDTPVRDVLRNLTQVVTMPQKSVADLLGVSTRQLQRWLAADGGVPAGDDEARIRIVAQLVNQLRHTFTGPGVVAWFDRKHPHLGVKPVQWLDQPLRYPQLLAAATASRAMTG